jgi:hypothetical protein
MSTVGKAVYMLLMCSSVQAALELYLTTMDDVPLKQGAIGEPFFIQVRDTESSGSIHQPHVEGLDPLVQQGTTFAMHTINNSSTVVYKYQVRADTPGTYTIGPASVNHAGILQASNSVEFNVGDCMIIDKKYQKKPTVFAILEADKECVVVGEKVFFTLTLYSSEQFQTRVQALQEPSELKELGLLIHDPENLEQGTKQIESKSYIYGQWQWELYPNHVGLWTIPAFSIDYTVLTSGNSFFSFMDWWENKRTYSNGVQLQIDPLPPYNGNVDGIGTFSAYTATLDTSVAQVGSAIVLCLSLTGDGNWGAMKEPELVILNDSIRAYYSVSGIKKTEATGSITKTFEYIVQGIKAGDVVLEPQVFTYFDTHDHTYKKLKTAPLYLTVTPSPNSIIFDESLEKVPRAERDICAFRTPTSNPSFPLRLPRWLFMLLLLLPLCILFSSILRDIYRWGSYRYRLEYTKKGAFKRAHQRIQQASTNKNFEALHTLFIQYFAEVSGIACAQVTADCMEKHLSVCTVEERAQWNLFFQTLVTLRFSDHESEGNEIFEYAQNWIYIFEQKRVGSHSRRLPFWLPFS